MRFLYAARSLANFGAVRGSHKISRGSGGAQLYLPPW